jgi:hypothetical protein
MPSIAEAEAQLRADNRPVLFLDTCVIVDIIRATLRCMGTNFVQCAIELRRLLKSAPPGCALVVASVVPTEWGNHAPRTGDEVRGHVAKILDQAQHFLTFTTNLPWALHECRQCGYSANADFNAARNIRARGLVKVPIVGLVDSGVETRTRVLASPSL